MSPARTRVLMSRWGGALGLFLIGARALFAGAWQETASRSAADEILVRTEGPRELLPLASALRSAWREQSEDVEVSLGAGLSDQARLDALASGAIDIALSSHEPGSSDLVGRGMNAQRIALTAVVFAVHADVTVLDLKPGEVCDIYSGRVTTWASFGGPPTPIRAFLRPATDVDTEVARAAIPCLKDLVVGPTVVIAQTAGDMRIALQSTPGAIGLTTSGAVRKSIVALRSLSISSISPSETNLRSGRYPLLRPAYFVTRSSPPPLVLRFLAFARSDRGAAAISDAGALPVR